MKRTERLVALSEMLRRSGNRGCSAEKLAQEFGVSVRTVKRDLDALENSGAPIWSRPGPGGGYGLASGGVLPPVTLSPAQAVALMAAVSAASDAPYADLAAAGVRKILDVLDPRTRARADELASRVWVNAPPPSSRAVRSALEEAMADQRVVRIRYTAKDGAVTTRDVDPVVHRLQHRTGECHLDGMHRAHRRGGRRTAREREAGARAVDDTGCLFSPVDSPSNTPNVRIKRRKCRNLPREGKNDTPSPACPEPISQPPG